MMQRTSHELPTFRHFGGMVGWVMQWTSLPNTGVGIPFVPKSDLYYISNLL